MGASGDIGVEVAAGAGCVSDFSCFVGEAEPVLVFIMPMLEKFMLGRPLPTNVEIVVKIILQQNNDSSLT